MSNQQSLSQIKSLIQSSSIILFDKSNPTSVLMFKRTGNISFPNHVVFPGGVSDQQDRLACQKIVRKVGFQQYSKITAIRELYQEAGILLIPNQKYQALISEHKQFDHKSITTQFICTLWKDHMHLLIPIIRLMTIQQVKTKRFDTIFYVLDASVIQANVKNLKSKKNIQDLSDLTISKSQSTQYFLLNPLQILEMSISKQIILAPPQLIILNCLRQISTPKELALINVKRSIEPILMNTTNFKTFQLYKDYQYPIKDILVRQPESKSKQNYIQYVKTQGYSSWQSMTTNKRRRFVIDFKTNQTQYITDYQEQSILKFYTQLQAKL